MDNYLNRIEVQRRTLFMVNKRFKVSEPLYGLSLRAIERWYIKNDIQNKEIYDLLIKLSDSIQFLASKSQEQISDEYKIIHNSVNHFVDELSEKINIHFKE